MTENKHSREQLRYLQSLPLSEKIQITVARLIEFVNKMGGVENVVISYSGGKDSTVLLHIAKQIYPDIKCVYSDTGLEYPEVRAMAKAADADIVRPEMNFAKVLTEYGYPLISKEVSEAIYYARRIRGERERESEREETTGASRKASGWNQRRKMFTGIYGNGERNIMPTNSIFNKQKYLPLVQLPIKISHKCCAVMKKSPLSKYHTKNKVSPIIATMADESRIREQAWLRQGCNVFDGSHGSKSQPMSFWTEQDVLTYIKWFDVEIASVYGEVAIKEKKTGDVYPLLDIDAVPEGFTLCTTGCDRTGCIFCGFGFHNEKGETRFQRLKRTHPKLYEYAIGGGQWIDNPEYNEDCPEYDGEWENWNPKQIWVPSKDGLGFGKVFDMCNDIYGKEFYRYQ